MNDVMNDTSSDVSSGVAALAAELRLAFDRSFAAPVEIERASREPVLVVRVGAQGFAIRLAEISGLFADKKVTPVPGSHRALRGIAGFRGAIVPVYDLQMLLGDSAAVAPRWLVIAAAAPIALAFDGFAGQLRVPRDAIVPQPSHSPHQGYVREFIRSRKFAGSILHLPSLLDAIKASGSK